MCRAMQAEMPPKLLSHKAPDLPYRTFDKIRKANRAAVVENKRLGAFHDMIRLLARCRRRPRP